MACLAPQQIVYKKGRKLGSEEAALFPVVPVETRPIACEQSVTSGIAFRRHTKIMGDNYRCLPVCTRLPDGGTVASRLTRQWGREEWVRVGTELVTRGPLCS